MNIGMPLPLWEGLVGAPRVRLPPRQPYLLANLAWGAPAGVTLCRDCAIGVPEN